MNNTIKLACAVISLSITSIVYAQLPAFSGDWVGQCDNDQQNEVKLHIEQTDYEIKLNLPHSPYEKGEFAIGGFKNSHETFQDAEEITTRHARWRKNFSALDLIYFITNTALNSHKQIIKSKLSKITLNMDEDRLILNTESFVIGYFNDTDHYKYTCSFQKKAAE